MDYYSAVLSPETYQAFAESPRDVFGFPARQHNSAERVRAGDKFICYVTGISSWGGVLEVTGPVFEDSSQRHYSTDAPFTISFNVRPIVWVPLEHTISVYDDVVWKALSFTANKNKNTSILVCSKFQGQ